MTDARYAIGLDVGGTKIAGGIVDEAGTLLTVLTERTPDDSDAEAVIAVLLDVVQRLRDSVGRAGDGAVRAIGLGAAGIVEWPAGQVVWAPNNAYRNWPVRAQLEKATGLPVVVDNDANVAALAESRLGERPYRDMVLLTVGTGIGGGIVLDGEIYRGRSGLAPELGHMIVNPDGPLCSCGNHGCLEALASGTALGRMGRDAAADEPDGLLARLGVEQGEITGHTVTEAAQQGDETARRLFDRLGRWLGVGIASLATIFELEAVIVGGGLSATGELLLAPTRAGAREFAYAAVARGFVPVLRATSGGDAGMIGAGLLAFEHHSLG